MIDLQLPSGACDILILGAHCDDIEIGAGGTLAKWAREKPEARFHWRIFTSNEIREAESRACAELLMAEADGRITVEVMGFRDGFLPYLGREVKEAFESLKAELKPDLILTHYRHDLHQDHRLINELTWNTWRNHLILEYEIPKWDGDLGIPGGFVHLSREDVDRKISALQAAYITQKGKTWFTDELFRSLLRIRGMECNSPSGYAEGFHIRKAVLI